MRGTIGMATYDDWYGVVDTVQTLRMFHAEALENCEILVVDNNPNSPHGWHTKGFCQNLANEVNPVVRYIPMPEKVGTTQPRERVFTEAQGEYVVVIDPHVKLVAGAIARLWNWFDEHPKCFDLVTGPLLYNNLRNYESQFNPVWNVDQVSMVVNGVTATDDAMNPILVPQNSEMWGVWGKDKRAEFPENEEFAIPGHGLGLFACRRAGWLGFNPHFRGFGGEELYIHRKFEMAGRRNLCLPFLRWWHRFGNPNGRPPYPLQRWHKVRNYVLGFKELGMSLDPVYEHFVASKLMSDKVWEYLVADPINRTTPPEQKEDDISFVGLSDTYEKINRDLNLHAVRLREIGAMYPRILAFTKRKEWDYHLLAGGVKKFHSHNKEDDPLRKLLLSKADDAGIEYRHTKEESLVAEIIPNEVWDLVILDTIHSRAQTLAELLRYRTSARRFLLRSTATYGEVAEGSTEPGMNHAMREFIQRFPEWFVMEHSDVQYGYTILSSIESERPVEPIWAWSPGFGPGTELKKILSSLGIKPSASCDCNGKADKMDRWGTAGCLKNKDVIVQWMREGQDKWGWTSKLTASFSAVVTGIAFKLNPLDPYPGIIDQAIQNAQPVKEVV